jgi:hypothetical protein
LASGVGHGRAAEGEASQKPIAVIASEAKQSRAEDSSVEIASSLRASQ